jgi:8-oxo-dGTP pyrophosphatase MutT (NUDIX family)
MRLAYRVAYRLLGVWAFIRRPRVRGVMVLLSDPRGRVLLVRHTYGDRRAWELPGGWISRGEAAVDAARRETFEELGADVDDWRPVVKVDGVWHHKHEELRVFGAAWPGGPVRRDPVEIAEARWFAPSAPPARLGEATQAVLAAVASS